MELGKTVIVAGIGSKKGVSAAEVIEAVDAALAEHGLERSVLATLATASLKRDEIGIVVASGTMSLPLALVDDAALAAMSDFILTRSAASMAATGVASVAEAAALAAAGEGARLAGPRIAVGRVTCAIAFGDGA